MHHINGNNEEGGIRMSKNEEWVGAVLMVCTVFNTAIYLRRGELRTAFWCGILGERAYLVDLEVDWRIVLQQMLKKGRVDDVGGIDLAHDTIK
jgi:hypothetical protein